MASFWMQRIKASSESIEDYPDVSGISKISDSEIPAFLEKRLGITFEEIDNNFLTSNPNEIESTEAMLNRYEHLAKLVELDVISKKDAQKFFYTMLSDTFIVCIPFILFRRKTKPSYAHKMQALLELLPKVSLNWSRV